MQISNQLRKNDQINKKIELWNFATIKLTETKEKQIYLK